MIDVEYIPSEILRCRVARNTETPPENLTLLARDVSHYVRREAAANPNTPLEALKQLAVDQDESVRWNAATNPSMPPMGTPGFRFNDVSIDARYICRKLIDEAYGTRADQFLLSLWVDGKRQYMCCVNKTFDIALSAPQSCNVVECFDKHVLGDKKERERLENIVGRQRFVALHNAIKKSLYEASLL